MPKFEVKVVRKFIQYETAIIKVDAEDQDSATEKARSIATGDPDPDFAGTDDTPEFWAAYDALQWHEGDADGEYWVAETTKIAE